MASGNFTLHERLTGARRICSKKRPISHPYIEETGLVGWVKLCEELPRDVSDIVSSADWNAQDWQPGNFEDPIHIAVASKFTEEHRAALDWLNEHTTEEISFFGLEIELWRIGVSPAAPKFNMISKPNDWQKAVRQKATAGTEGERSKEKQLQFEFWTAFKAWLEERTSLRTQKPAYQHWLSLSLGRTGFQLSAIASHWNTPANEWGMPELRVELIFNSPLAKTQFAQLRTREAEVQQKIDLPLTWHDPPTSKSCKLYVRRDCDFRERSNWDEAFKWLAKYLQQFSDTFRPIIREL